MNSEEIRRAAESIGLAKGERADEATVERRVERIKDGVREHLAKTPAVLTFWPYRRPRSWAEREGIAPSREVVGATMRDEYGDAEYDVVLEDGALVSYAVRAINGALTEPYAIGEQPRELPRDLVVHLVGRYLTGDLPGDDADTLLRSEAWVGSSRRTRSQEKRARAPRVEFVADIMREVAATGGTNFRTAVQVRSQGRTEGKPASIATVDRWIAEARAAYPDLPQAKRHPGKRKTTTMKGTEER